MQTIINVSKQNIIFVLSLITLAAVMSGCETTSAIPYTASTPNVLQFQSVLTSSNAKVKLGTFVDGEDVSELTCRLMGPVDVSRGKTKAEYIKEAMQTELFLAQVYSVDSDIILNGKLDSVDFSSVSPASWKFGFTISSNKYAGYSVNTKYSFNTSYSAYSACENVADAFGPAVQDLINNIVTHPDFVKLVNGTDSAVGAMSTKQRLIDLKELFDKELISEAEYEKAREALLSIQ
jgi:hypothetical protein